MKQWIHPGTTIISDYWAFYSTVFEGYQHKTANHSITFVDSITGAHTNTTESTWRHGKVSQANSLYTYLAAKMQSQGYLSLHNVYGDRQRYRLDGK
jgi:hypothetical protein